MIWSEFGKCYSDKNRLTLNSECELWTKEKKLVDFNDYFARTKLALKVSKRLFCWHKILISANRLVDQWP